MVHELASMGLLSEIRSLVGVEQLGLDYIRATKHGLAIGAAATLTDMIENSAIARTKPLMGLLDALREIRPVQVRNVATIGGAICSAAAFFDLPVALMACDAAVRVFSARGWKKIPLVDFYKGMFETVLRPGEIVAEVVLGFRGKPAVSAFEKLSQSGDDFALVNAGASLEVSGNLTCKRARIIVGGGGLATPVSCVKAEGELVGNRLGRDALLEAARQAGQEVDFSSDVRATGEYRKAVCPEIVSRCLDKALRRTREWKNG